MNVLYIDPVSGISGDMALAALIDAGADLSAVARALKSLDVDGFELETENTLTLTLSHRERG